MEQNKILWANSTLIGKVFGLLTVIDLVKTDKPAKSGGRLWKCKCSCGNECNVNTGNLHSSNTKSCGCIQSPDLIGQKFGKLTAIKYEGIRNTRSTYLCECECGGTKIVRASQLKSGAVKSCGCLRSGYLKDGIRNLGKGVAIRNLIIGTYKGNAEKNNREFTLTIERCETLFSGNCFYCAEPPSRIRTNIRTKDSFTYNGIDRVDNNLGYTNENSVSCCTDCNLRKRSESKEDFLKWVKKIYLNHFS
ncbi:MAG TPA: hypothetical protein VNX68_05990 [Nitrosopumilaceae archaeon]|jgi:hypothetical protein|nr:hypothetical protein [Nitrosopumilaceae archaeon]